jgi:hypothetical protein
MDRQPTRPLSPRLSPTVLVWLCLFALCSVLIAFIVVAGVASPVAKVVVASAGLFFCASVAFECGRLS